jgi:hypothetical protein
MLRVMEQAGEIAGLEHHVNFDLKVGTALIGRYEADFVYTQDGKHVIEDAKGVLTALFRWKAKHMAAQGDPVTVWPKKAKKAKKARIPRIKSVYLT